MKANAPKMASGGSGGGKSGGRDKGLQKWQVSEKECVVWNMKADNMSSLTREF